MIVDAHMHVGEFPLFNVRMDGDQLAATMREFGIEAGIVFHPDHELTRQVVERIAGAWALVWANPRMPGYVEAAHDFLAHPRCLGIKLHPLLDGYHPNDPTVHPLAELAIERDVPVLVHCGHPIFTLPWSIEELAVSYPDLKLILGHMGHGNIVYINGAIDVAARNPNVYLETSGMPMHAKIVEAVDRAGPDRVLYGSDAPFHEVGAELRKVQACGLPQELVDRVLHRNARALFFGHEDATEPVTEARSGS